MLKPRWILLLLAVATAFLVVDFARRTAAAGPDTYLAAGRAAAEADPPDYDGAVLNLERGLLLARAADDRDALQDLLREKARTFLERWERAASDPEEPQLASDLDEVVRLTQSAVLEFGPEDPALLEMGARAAHASGKDALAASFLRQLLALTPATPELELLLGDAQLGLVDRTLVALTERLRAIAPESETTIQRDTLRRALTLPFHDPRRSAELEKLTRDLPPIHVRPLLAELDLGSRNLGRATAAYQRVLAERPDGLAVVGLVRVLLLADSVDRAADLAAIALATPGLTEPQAVVRTTLRAFLELGRREQAERLLARALAQNPALLEPEGLSREQRVAWCPLLLRLERWAELLPLARSVLDEDYRSGTSDEDTKRTRFTFALALSHVGSKDYARAQLLRVEPKVDTDYAGMRLEWAEALGRCDLALGDERAAHRDLHVATQAIPRDPLPTRLQRVAGHALRAYGELLAGDEDVLRAEDALTRALELLPAERGAIEAAWRRVGLAAMAKRGRSAEVLRRHPLERTPEGRFPPMGAFEACLRAEASLDQGEVGPIPVLLQPTLEAYPRFAPALELLARSELLRGRFDRAIEAQLDLLDQGQRSKAGLALLRAIPEGTFRGEQRRRWILADPTAGGWTAVLDELASRGDHTALRRTLEDADLSALSPRQLAHAARLAADDDALPLAIRLLEAIPRAAPERATSAGLELAVAVRLSERLHDPAPLVHTLSAGLASPTAGPIAAAPDLLDALRWSLAGGHAARVGPLLARVVQEGTTRREETLALLAQQALLVEDLPAAHEAVDRAEPWMADREARLLRLLIAVREGDKPRTVELALDLLSNESGWSTLEARLLARLGADSAAIRAADQRVQAPDPGLFVPLLRASADGSEAQRADLPGASPDLTLALLLASGRPHLAAWAAGTVTRLGGDARSSALGVWLLATSWDQLGRPDTAEKLLAVACERRDEPELFALRERLARDAASSLAPGEHGRAATRYAEAVAQHLARLGAAGLPPEDVELARLRTTLLSEGRKVALSQALRALESVPDSLALRIEAARLTNEPGRRVEALERYESLLLRFPTAPLDHLVPELTALLEQAVREGELSPDALGAELDALASRFPADPTLARLLASWTLERTEVVPEWAVRRSWDVLERFQRDHSGASIESLRPGEAARWYALLAPYDPARAEAFVRAELDRHLGSGELWARWISALAREGRGPEALRAYESITQVLSSPELDRGEALLRLDLGLRPSADLLPTGPEAANGGDDPELTARCAAALGRGTSAQAARARELGLSLWERREELHIPALPLARDLARAFAPVDPERAAELLDEAVSASRSPLEITLLEAARSLICAGAAAPRT